MTTPTRRYMSQMEVIEIITLSKGLFTFPKTITEKEIADHFGISQPGVTYFLKKYEIDSGEKADKILTQLYQESNEYMGINYHKQSTCISKSFYFRCNNCRFVASEKNIQGILDHIGRCKVKEEKLLTQQTI